MNKGKKKQLSSPEKGTADVAKLAENRRKRRSWVSESCTDHEGEGRSRGGKGSRELKRGYINKYYVIIKNKRKVIIIMY